MKCFGVKFWEAATVKRREYFANYDGLSNSSWESIMKILKIREEERAENARREAEAFSAEATDALNEHKQVKEELFEERQERREMKLQRTRGKELEEERAEREAWAEFIQHKNNMDADCPPDNLNWRCKERQLMWNKLDDITDLHKDTLDAQETRDMELADGPDGDAKAEHYLSTNAGLKKLRYDTIQIYGTLVHSRWEKGNSLQKSLAPMFVSETPNQITLFASIIRKLHCGSGSDLKTSSTDAKEVTVESYHKLEKELTDERYVKLKAQSEIDFKNLISELVEKYGTRNTHWEVLFDASQREGKQRYHFNYSKKRFAYGDPAICEMCDEDIDPLDFKCFGCNSFRSAINQPKYTGRTPLSELMDMSLLAGKKTEDIDFMVKTALDYDEDSEEDDGDMSMKGKINRKMRQSRKSITSMGNMLKDAKVGDIQSMGEARVRRMSSSMQGGMSSMQSKLKL